MASGSLRASRTGGVTGAGARRMASQGRAPARRAETVTRRAAALGLSAAVGGAACCTPRAVEPRPEPKTELGPPRAGPGPEVGGAAAPARAGAGFELHEWGVIVVADPADGGAAPNGAAVAAPTRDWRRPGPIDDASGERRRPPSERADEPRDLIRPAKPLIWIHLAPGVDERELSVELGLATGGSFVERWPLGELLDRAGARTSLGPVALRWDPVRARRGACASPAIPAAHCQTADGYCEARALPTYQTDDAACLHVDGQAHNALFYRAELQAAALPVRVERAGARRIVTIDGPVGPVVWARRRTVGARTTIRVVLLPAGSGPVELDLDAGPRPDVAALARPAQWLADQLAALGLTAPELASFDRAWSDELWAGEILLPPDVPPAFRPPRDALIYLLEPAAVERLLPLAVTPAPDATRRALVVRHAL